MPAGPDDGARLAARVVDLYLEAELVLLRRVARSLANGIGAPDWAQRKLAELTGISRSTEHDLNALHRAGAEAVTETVGQAYSTGALLARVDVATAGRPPGLPEATRRAATRIAAETIGAIAATTTGVLRTLNDAYQRAVADASGAVLLGATDRRSAAQSALNRLLGQGIGGFQDTAGRAWRLDSYVEMAVRTATGRAAVQGHVEHLTAAGLDLVYVSNSPRECPKCRPWEGKILSISGSAVGTIQVLSVVDDTQVRVHIAGSLDRARADGFQHPNCTHSLSAYLPGATPTPPATPNPAGYIAQQQQRAIERNIRNWKRREALALDVPERRLAAGKVAGWQDAMRAHLREHPELKRQAAREQLAATAPGPIPAPRVRREQTPPGYRVEEVSDDEAGRRIDTAVTAVARVLSLPEDLPERRIRTADLPPDTLGQFDPADGVISVSPGGPHQALTVVHELAHFIDLHLLGDGQVFATDLIAAGGRPPGDLVRVMAAIQSSAAVRELHRQLSAAEADLLRYQVGFDELWSRAFAQWIAQVSGDQQLLADLQSGLDPTWSTADFAPIAEALAELFRGRGLLP